MRLIQIILFVGSCLGLVRLVVAGGRRLAHGKRVRRDEETWSRRAPYHEMAVAQVGSRRGYVALMEHPVEHTPGEERTHTTSAAYRDGDFLDATSLRGQSLQDMREAALRNLRDRA